MPTCSSYRGSGGVARLRVSKPYRVPCALAALALLGGAAWGVRESGIPDAAHDGISTESSAIGPHALDAQLLASAELSTEGTARASRYYALLAGRKLDPRVTTMAPNGTFSISRQGILRPPGDAIEFASTLVSASNNGDSVATYDLFLLKLQCETQMRPSAASRGYADLEGLSECERLLSDDSLMRIDWLTRAADQGSIEAMLMYGVNPAYTLGSADDYIKDPDRVSEWKSRAIGQLSAAAELGSQDALFSLSSAYDNGVLVKGDRVQAYAYALSADIAAGGLGSSDLLDIYRKVLSRTELEAARKRSREILTRCCNQE